MSERVHVVVKGDTLWGLSRHYKVELDELMTLNNLYGRRQHNLSIGQTIKLPDGTGVPDTELTLRILDLAFRPIVRARLKLEYDGSSREVVGDTQGEVGPIHIEDHAKGIKVHFRELDGEHVLIADHQVLPLGRKRLILTSRRMLLRGAYPSEQGRQRKATETVRREVRRRNPDAHIRPGQAMSPSTTSSGALSGDMTRTSRPQRPATPVTPGVLDEAKQAALEALNNASQIASETWDRLTGRSNTPPQPRTAPNGGRGGGANPEPQPVVSQTRTEGGRPTQVVGPLFAEANLKLRPANEKYRQIILDVAKRHGMAPQSLAAVINAEAAKAPRTGEWLASSQASTSTAAGLTQFLDATWLEMATERRSLVNQLLKRNHRYEQVNAAYTEGPRGRRLDYIYGQIAGKRQRIDSGPVLRLRFDPEYSIDAGAVYALKNLEIMSELGINSSGLASEDLAKLMYIAHHEGAGGACKVLKGTLTAARAAELLPKQVPNANRRAQLLARFENDYKAAYIHWLFTYTDTMIDVRDFMVNPGSFTPKTTSQIAVAVNGTRAVAPAARRAPAVLPSGPPKATTPPTTATGAQSPAGNTGVSAQAWRNPLDVNRIRTAGLASWRGATFGMVRSGGSRAHQGVDLIAVPGTAVYAVGNGRVVSVYRGFSDTQGFGATVILCVDVEDLPDAQRTSYRAKRPNDTVVYFAYCHLSQIDVTVRNGGTPVTIGTKLGETGQSGNARGMNTVARGAHLHFEVRYQHPLPAGRTGLQYRVDPRPFLLQVLDPG